MATVSDPMTPNSAGAVPGAQRSGLPLMALTALAIGSMIGAGIFNIPSDMAASAAPGPVLIGWSITGVGMLMLALTFQMLSTTRPEVDGGVYGYACAGFGNFIGFTSAWGYWISAWVGNVAFLVMVFGTLGNFFPIFAEVEGADGSFGPGLAGIIGASLLLWGYHVLVLRGVREAAILNTLVTVAKIVPLLLFIVLTGIAFKMGVFTSDFWGQAASIDGESLGSTMDQVKNMMLVTVWVFIGIEGASIFSSRAEKRSDVGKATVIGFLSVLALLVLVNLMSYGILAQAEIAGLSKPSMAGVLSSVVGPWGTWFISAGLVVSILGALLSWTLLCSEILLKPAQEGVMPRWIARENKNGAPVGALWMTTLSIQAMLVWTMVNSGTYNTLIYLASALVLLPYLWSALYAVVTAVRDGGTGERHITPGSVLVASVAIVYALWLVYAAGLEYTLLACVFYVIGLVFYVWARKENGLRVFTPVELGVLALVVIGAVFGVLGVMSGSIEI